MRVYAFSEPVRMQVLHPKYGVCDVVAYTNTDARMQAGNFWGMSYQEEQESRVAIETARLKEARIIEADDPLSAYTAKRKFEIEERNAKRLRETA